MSFFFFVVVSHNATHLSATPVVRTRHPRCLDADILTKKKYGKRLVSIDTTSGPGVTATFQDGTTHTATILVGAEGAHSPVREHLLGPDKGALLNSGIVLSILQSKLPVDRALALRALHHRIACAFHPSGMFMWFGGKAGRQPF